MENVVEVQRRWRVEFGTPPPTRVTITRIRDKFEVDGTVRDALKGRCGRKRSSIDNNSADAIMQSFARYPKKSLSQCSREIGIEKSSVHRIFNELSMIFHWQQSRRYVTLFDIVVGRVLWQKVDILNMYGLKEV